MFKRSRPCTDNSNMVEANHVFIKFAQWHCHAGMSLGPLDSEQETAMQLFASSSLGKNHIWVLCPAFQKTLAIQWKCKGRKLFIFHWTPHFDLILKSEKSTLTICSKHVGYFSENKDVENKEMNSCSSSGVVAIAHISIYIFGIHSTSGVLKISPELVRLVLVTECAVYHVISVGSE